MKASVELVGFRKLTQELSEKAKKVESASKTVVVQYTGKLKREVLTNTLPGGTPKIDGITKTRPGKIFVKGYSDANIHDSIMDVVEKTDNGYSGTVMSNMAHAATMEYGGRFVQPEPWMRPAVDKIEPAFIEAMEKVVK